MGGHFCILTSKEKQKEATKTMNNGSEYDCKESSGKEAGTHGPDIMSLKQIVLDPHYSIDGAEQDELVLRGEDFLG